MEGTFPSLVRLLDLEILIVRTSDFVLRSWCTLWYLLLFGFRWTFPVSVCSVSASPHPTPEGEKQIAGSLGITAPFDSRQIALADVHVPRVISARHSCL